MSAVLQNDLSVVVSAHFACGRMFYTCEIAESLHNVTNLLLIATEVKTMTDKTAIYSEYHSKFTLLPRIVREALETKLKWISRDS